MRAEFSGTGRGGESRPFPSWMRLSQLTGPLVAGRWQVIKLTCFDSEASGARWEYQHTGRAHQPWEACAKPAESRQVSVPSPQMTRATWLCCLILNRVRGEKARFSPDKEVRRPDVISEVFLTEQNFLCRKTRPKFPKGFLRDFQHFLN